jgi:hypothetical protein
MIRLAAAMAATGFLLLTGDDRVWAQAPQHQFEHQVDLMMILEGTPHTGTAASPLITGNPDIDFLSMPLGLGGETVTGAPYSAEAVTVMVQTLADGNRISRESKAGVYRDTAGRTRREQGLGIVGATASGPEDRQQVHIADPRAGVTYILDTGNRTAHKLPIPRIASAQSSVPTAAAGAGTFELPLPPPASGGQGAVFFRRNVIANSKPPAVEPLGRQIVEGVEAEGTRSTTTIPAGQIGNELPLTIVSERWFSPELRVLVMSRQTDPRIGETTYRLTNIVRAEPSPDLFEPPPEFTVVEPGAAAGTAIRMRKR